MLQALNCVLTVRKYSVKSNFRYKTKKQRVNNARRVRFRVTNGERSETIEEP